MWNSSNQWNRSSKQFQSFQPQPPRKSANVILYGRDANDKTPHMLVGKGCFIHCDAILEIEEKLSSELLEKLVLGIANGIYKFTSNGRLEGKGADKFHLGKNFNGILLSGLCSFPGGGLQGNETFKKAACRELREEFYLKTDSISGGENTIMENLEPVVNNKDKRFFSLNLNVLGLTPDEIIQEFNSRIKQLGDLSPKTVWEKYKDAKNCPLFPEMREIIKVEFNESNVEKVFLMVDEDYAKKEMGLFCDFLCDLIEIKDSATRGKFTENMIQQMAHLNPSGGEHLPAAKTFISQQKKTAKFKNTEKDEKEVKSFGNNPYRFLMKSGDSDEESPNENLKLEP